MALLLFIIVFLLVIIISLTRRKGFNVSTLLVSFYLLSYISSIVLIYRYKSYTYDDYTAAQLYLFFLLLVFLAPVLSQREDKVKYILIPENNVLKLFSLMMTVLSLFSLIYFIPAAVKALMLNASQIEGVRNLVAKGENPFIDRTIFNTVAGVGANFYFIQIILFYIYIIKENAFSKYSYLLLFSSLSYVIHVFAYVGRDGVVFWFMSFTLTTMFFYPYLGLKIRRRITTMAMVILIPIVIAFIFITFGRFVYGNNSDESFLYSIFNYLGQGPLNFSRKFNLELKALGGSVNFPLFVKEVNTPALLYNQYIMEQNGLYGGVFMTFVGSFLSDFGKIGTFLFALVVNRFFSILGSSNKGKWTFSFLLMYYLYVTVLSQGIFYFRQYNNAGNLVIIFIVFLAVFFYYLPKQRLLLKKNI